MRKFLDKEAAQNFVLLLALVIVYSPVLFAVKTVGPDGDIILGPLKEIGGIGQYFKSLLNFELIDFQPVRDLTLFLDLHAFSKWGLNTFIIQNVIYWFLGCVFAGKILRLLYPNRYLLIFLFAVYPLFAGTVSWNMARKHILAFMFIAMATYELLRSRPYRATVFYFLSVFSQPITILWPVWALTQKRPLKSLVPAFVILTIAFILNFNYYQSSKAFLDVFDPKTNTIVFADMILAMGHYAFQLFLPYWQGLYYSLGDWFIWVGVLIILFLCLLVRRLDKSKLSWVLFSVLPLITVIVKPQMIYDTYLLVPALGAFFVLVSFDISKKILIPVFFIWSAFTFYETGFWTDKIKFAEKNFKRRENCASATRLARQKYASEGRLPEEVKSFLKYNQCFDESTNFKALDALILKSHLAFYEEGLSPEKKYELLSYYGQFNFYPMLIQIAYLIKEGRHTEANRVLSSLVDKSEGRLEASEDRIFGEVVRPFCEQQGNQKCLAILAPLISPGKTPYW